MPSDFPTGATKPKEPTPTQTIRMPPPSTATCCTIHSDEKLEKKLFTTAKNGSSPIKVPAQGCRTFSIIKSQIHRICLEVNFLGRGPIMDRDHLLYITSLIFSLRPDRIY